MPDMIRKNTAGTLGQSVQLITNNYQVTFTKPKNTVIYQYDLCMVDAEDPDPDLNSVPSKMVCQLIFRALQLPAYVAYDGKKNLYSPRKEDSALMGVTTQIPLNRKTYNVSIKKTEPGHGVRVQDILDAIRREGALVPIDAVNALNIILTHPLAFNSAYTTVKRSYFPCSQPGTEMPGGLRLWSGIHTSVTPTQGFGITIRTLKTYQVMYPGGKVLDFLVENLGLRNYPNSLNPGQRRDISKTLKTMKIQTSHNQQANRTFYTRRYTIKGLSDKSAKQATLDNTPQTIERYFLARYDRKLQYPNLPCIQVGRNALIPLEVCEMVPNQPYYTNLTALQQARMIKSACAQPDKKIADIQEVTDKVKQVTGQFTNDNYGFSINPKALKVTGRILPTPKMDGRSQVQGGQWTMRAVLKRPGNVPIKSVRIIALCTQQMYNPHLHNKFVSMMEKKASELNIYVPPVANIRVLYSRVDQLRDHFDSTGSYSFIILDGDWSYGEVKLLETDTQYTQCLKLQTVQKVCGMGRGKSQGKLDYNTLDNILKKYNTKLGGVNWSIDTLGLPTQIFNGPVIIVGADVTHFTRDEGKPSIAAVVATCDREAAQYISKVAVMYPGEGRKTIEYITDMKNIMVSLLKQFREKSKCIPGRIIYYRDGVSEGQFENTVMCELEGIQEACTALSPNYKPKISVVVCTKRHKQRFVTPAGGRGRDTHGNMVPGTTVDTGVVSPNYSNWYTCSQQAIQGTSVPCHYYLLYDDSKLSTDMWQMLSFFLCHTYARCSRSVSYPAPIYYAHLACFSARSRMLARYPQQDWTTERRPAVAAVEQAIRPDGFNMFFI